MIGIGGMILRLILDTIDENLIIKFKGELDHHTTEKAREKIDKWYFEKRKRNIIFDLRELNFMDSSGIGLMMGRYKTCKENGGEVFIVNSSSNIERILRMSGIYKIIGVYPTVDSILENNLEG